MIPFLGDLLQKPVIEWKDVDAILIGELIFRNEVGILNEITYDAPQSNELCAERSVIDMEPPVVETFEDLLNQQNQSSPPEEEQEEQEEGQNIFIKVLRRRERVNEFPPMKLSVQVKEMEPGDGANLCGVCCAFSDKRFNIEDLYLKKLNSTGVHNPQRWIPIFLDVVKCLPASLGGNIDEWTEDQFKLFCKTCKTVMRKALKDNTGYSSDEEPERANRYVRALTRRNQAGGEYIDLSLSLEQMRNDDAAVFCGICCRFYKRKTELDQHFKKGRAITTIDKTVWRNLICKIISDKRCDAKTPINKWRVKYYEEFCGICCRIYTLYYNQVKKKYFANDDPEHQVKETDNDSSYEEIEEKKEEKEVKREQPPVKSMERMLERMENKWEKRFKSMEDRYKRKIDELEVKISIKLKRRKMKCQNKEREIEETLDVMKKDIAVDRKVIQAEAGYLAEEFGRVNLKLNSVDEKYDILYKSIEMEKQLLKSVEKSDLLMSLK